MKRYGGMAFTTGIMFSDGEYYSIGTRNCEGEIETIVMPEKSILPKRILKISILRGILLPFEMILDICLNGKLETFTNAIIPKEAKKNHKTNNYLYNLLMSLLIIITFIYIIPLILSKLLHLYLLPSISQEIIMRSIWFLEILAYLYFANRVLDFPTVRGYHGAEHKVINCYEQNKEIALENISKSSKIHARCGTSLLGYFLILNIISMSVLHWFDISNSFVITFLIMSIAFEVFEYMYKKDFILFRPLKKFGLFLQKFTTSEPSEDQIEVATHAFNSLINYKDLNINTQRNSG